MLYNENQRTPMGSAIPQSLPLIQRRLILTPMNARARAHTLYSYESLHDFIITTKSERRGFHPKKERRSPATRRVPPPLSSGGSRSSAMRVNHF